MWYNRYMSIEQYIYVISAIICLIACVVCLYELLVVKNPTSNSGAIVVFIICLSLAFIPIINSLLAMYLICALFNELILKIREISC